MPPREPAGSAADSLPAYPSRMDLSVAARLTAANTCPACGTASKPASPLRLYPRTPRSYRGAWFVLACAFAFMLLWANRFEYQVCDVDGCVRIDRWTSQVEWIGSDVPAGPDAPYSVQVKARPAPADTGPSARFADRSVTTRR
jgi:hypothetical protein